MKYMIIENDITLIKHYDAQGVDRIFVDLEIIGKHERQGHLDTVISTHHDIQDIARIRPHITNAQLLVRVNPIHEHSAAEIEQCIAHGADIIMLPMFTTAQEVEYFVKQIMGRATVCLLLETAQAMCRIDEILSVDGIDEIHIGLNDLHLACGLKFMFELLTGGIVEYLANKIKAKGIAFGFGGVATCKGGIVSGEFVLSEHVRLGSSMVILSRAFKNIASDNLSTFNAEFSLLRQTYEALTDDSSALLLERQEMLRKNVQSYVNNAGK